MQVRDQHQASSLIIFFFDTRFLYIALTVLELTICTPGQPCTQKEPPASATQVLRLKAYIITYSFLQFLCVYFSVYRCFARIFVYCTTSMPTEANGHQIPAWQVVVSHDWGAGDPFLKIVYYMYVSEFMQACVHGLPYPPLTTTSECCPPHWILGIEPRYSSLQDKHFTDWATTTPLTLKLCFDGIM